MDTLISLFSTVKDILLELGGYFGDSRMILIVSAAVMAITLLTHLIFKKIRIMKYLPGLIVLGIGIFNFYTVMDKITAEESIVNLLLFVVGAVAGLVGMSFALIIGIYTKPVKRKKRKTAPKATNQTEEKENS